MLPESSSAPGSFGVEMTAIDVGQLAREDAAHLNGMLQDHSLLILRGQSLSFEDQIALTAVFGTVDQEVRPSERQFRHPDDIRIHVVSNASEGPTLATASTFWHTDQSFRPSPSPVIVLKAVVVPATGGRTMFANMRAAYAALPPERRAALDGLTARHRFGAAFGIGEMMTAHGGGSVHPIVRTDERTQRRSLYLNQFCMDSIEGLSTAEGTELLNSLYAHVLKPEFVYVHAWRPGDVLIWDNLALMHRLVDVPPLPRILHRTHTRA